MKAPFSLAGAVVAVVLVVLAMSIFTVDQRQYALVFQLGEVKQVISEPGLSFKVPLIQNVRYFEKRIITLDNADPERFYLAVVNPVGSCQYLFDTAHLVFEKLTELCLGSLDSSIVHQCSSGKGQ